MLALWSLITRQSIKDCNLTGVKISSAVKTNRPVVPPAATLYLRIAPCTVLTQVSDLAWKANWETQFSSDKQPFHKNTNPPNPQNRGPFQITLSVCATAACVFLPTLVNKRVGMAALFFFWLSQFSPSSPSHLA